jgi:hypothetical protein
MPNSTYAALAEFGAPLQRSSPDDFTNPNNFSHDPKGIDVVSLKGIRRFGKRERGY